VTESLDIGYGEATALVLAHLHPLPPVAVAVEDAVDMVLAEPVVSGLNSPSVTASLKDGLAVVSTDLAGASPESPVRLQLLGTVVAGEQADLTVKPGRAVQVMTGARVPEGANAVLAGEFADLEGETALCRATARPGRNILPAGSDVAEGQKLMSRGRVVTPAMCGLMAAAGLARIPVHPRPRVGLVATGDEVVAPGGTLGPGQLYASNLVTLSAWLRHFRMDAQLTVASDDPDEIRRAVREMAVDNDVLLTSGGAWKSVRDRTVRILEELGWKKAFHRVRLGPGKAAAFGFLEGKPVFCLPGGPPSNEMAFLQLALPGLLRMAGLPPRPFASIRARLAHTLRGDPDWTQFFQVGLEEREGEMTATGLRSLGRLRSQAAARGLVQLPEGRQVLEAGTMWDVQVLFRDGWGTR